MMRDLIKSPPRHRHIADAATRPITALLLTVLFAILFIIALARELWDAGH